MLFRIENKLTGKLLYTCSFPFSFYLSFFAIFIIILLYFIKSIFQYFSYGISLYSIFLCNLFMCFLNPEKLQNYYFLLITKYTHHLFCNLLTVHTFFYIHQFIFHSFKILRNAIEWNAASPITGSQIMCQPILANQQQTKIPLILIKKDFN